MQITNDPVKIQTTGLNIFFWSTIMLSVVYYFFNPLLTTLVPSLSLLYVKQQ